MGFFSTLLNFFGFDLNVNGQTPLPPKTVQKSVPFDTQIETFRKLGFILNSDRTADIESDLRRQKEIENNPYSYLYTEFGGTINREPWTPIGDRCWDFDTEAIEDHGAYVEIMQNLERITRGELKFDNLKDFVDVENENAWVSFSIGGSEYKWNLKVDNDWIDPELFTKLVALTNKLKTKGRYTVFNTGGQNVVIGFETPQHTNAIIKSTGLNVEWLD